MRTRLLVAGYLFANVAANLIIASTPLEWRWLLAIGNSLAFIALDITGRDTLHDVWHGDARKLAALIGAGAALSVAANWGAWPIALASCLAFAASGASDTIAYRLLHHRTWYTRVNGSNAVSAIVDSALFLGIAAALGVFPWFTVPAAFAGQVLAKIIGGAAWAWVLRPRKKGEAAYV